MSLFDANLPYTSNFVICMLIHSAFSSLKGEANTYLIYLKSLQTKEEESNIDGIKIIDIFVHYLSKTPTQESYYLLENMISRSLIDPSITKNIKTKYFSHYKTKEECKKYISSDPFSYSFLKNIDELSKNDWEFHKQLVCEGVNPTYVTKAIRSDNIDALQEIS